MIDTLLFFRESVLAAMTIALGCSVVGVYVVLRRVVWVGATLAQLSSAGMAAGLALSAAGIGLGPLTEPLALGLVFTLGGVAFFAVHDGKDRIPADAVLGSTFVVAGATAVLLVARAATADIHELFFGGSVLFIDGAELGGLLAVIGPVVLLHTLLYKEFVFVSYDPEMAAASGYRVRRWTVLLYLTFGVVITVSMLSAGVLLVFSLLVLPGVTGLMLAKRMAEVFAWAIGSGQAGTLIGFAASVVFDLPTGPCIIVVLGTIALIAWSARLGLARPARASSSARVDGRGRML